MKNKIELLVVEDKPHHLADARELFNERIKNGIALKVDYSTNYEGAERNMENIQYDGIISDIFFPNRNKERDIFAIKTILKKGEEYSGKADFDMIFKDELPYGILVGELALKKEIHLVLITDTYHHGNKTEPINGWASATQVPLIDRLVDEYDWKNNGIDYELAMQHQFSEKKWLEAYSTLMWMIEGKENNLLNINAGEIDTELPLGRVSSMLKDVVKNEPLSEDIDEEYRKSFEQVTEKYLKDFDLGITSKYFKDSGLKTSPIKFKDLTSKFK